MFYRSIARLLARDPQKQVNLILRMSLRYPFGRPGYDWTAREAPNAYLVDFHRCPVHDYFRSQGEEAVEFFRNSWCTLDFAVAEVMVKGGAYERTRTLSAGDSVCDMKWTIRKLAQGADTDDR